MPGFLGDLIDNIGTKLNLPELGLSEFYNGGTKSTNTGRINYSGTYGSAANKAFVNADPISSNQYVNDANWNSLNYIAANRPQAAGNDANGSGTYDQYGIYSGGAGGGGVAPSYNPADIAYLDDQRGRLEAQQRSADSALTNGLTQLTDSYNKEVSGANAKRSQALEDFATKRTDTERAKDSALTRVGDNARTLAEGLRRRLGLASGSGSSAYQLAAPGAVSRQATENRTGVLENFGQNFRDLSTAENRAKTGFEELLADLEAQRKTRESDFRSGILDKKNQIDNNLAEVARQKALTLGGGYAQAKAAMQPYSSAIDSRQAEIDNLFNRFRTPYSIKAVDTSIPTLRDYMVDRANISAGQPGPQDTESPYKNPFLQKQDDSNVAIY